MKQILILFVTFLLIGMFATESKAETLIELDRFRPGKIEMVGFEISKPAEITIEAVGIKQRSGSKMAAYAWLLDHETREVVWEMRKRASDPFSKNRSALRKTEKVKALDPGKYELYYFTGEEWFTFYGNTDVKDVIDFLGDIFTSDDDDDYDSRDYYDMLDRCYVKINSNEISSSDVTKFEITGEQPNALISANMLGNHEHIQKAFKLNKPTNLKIYSLIEHPRGYKAAADHGWIVDSKTRKKVWEMDRWSTDRAGGGRKNRMFNDEIRLEAGEYVLHFITDDSHSWESFNTNPPSDPMAWGITVSPGDNFDRTAFELIDLPEELKPKIDLSHARNDEYLEEHFRLMKDTEVRIYAIGEFSSGDFHDYGWIKDRTNNKIIFEMTKGNTEHAGGASKNRMFDDIITLPAGEYSAYYVTDGSHSYRNWNATRPYDAGSWGLSIFAVDENDLSNFETVSRDDIRQNSNILAEITRVRDRARRHETFELEKSTRVNIYALGEGTGRTMHDFAWIEDDDSRRVVWEMTMRNTDHAGGADKNRMFEGSITLDAGTYTVFYESDGSHSFNDWNASRPRDPQSWGVTISIPANGVAKR